MSNLEKLDIKALTKDAEAGKGCAIRDALGPLFWEERMQALKQIDAQNKMNRAVDSSIVGISFHYRASRGVDLHHQSGWFGAGPVLYDTWLDRTGTRTATCTDLKL